MLGDPAPLIAEQDLPKLILYGNQPPANLQALRRDGWEMEPLAKAPSDVAAVVVVEPENLGLAMRMAEPLSKRGVLVVPADPAALVSPSLRQLDALGTAWKTTPDTNYIARCGLKGHYLEFGTWYGRSFFPNFYQYRHWLLGNFYAFDSFAGLSPPLPLETEFTGGDFYEGGYCCNKASFEAIADLVEFPRARLHIVPGFYDETLQRSPEDYGLSERSVSVCIIDCDLRSPTERVLEFVTPLLEPGALIYFDDWRLTRASSVVGERAAALEWLKKNPSFELIEFHRDLWQHQWFIFQR